VVADLPGWLEFYRLWQLRRGESRECRAAGLPPRVCRKPSSETGASRPAARFLSALAGTFVALHALAYSSRGTNAHAFSEARGGCSSMANTNDRDSQSLTEPRPVLPGAVSTEAKDGSPVATADQAAPSDHHVTPTTRPTPGTAPRASENKPPSHRLRKRLSLAAVVACLAVGGYFLVPWVETATGPHAGDVLQPLAPLPTGPTAP
jgi:hypothetical protein